MKGGSGWISKRALLRGCALYEGGPKRKGPLRKIIRFMTFNYGIFESSCGWLECGHYIDRIFGREKAICHKCLAGLPKDKMRKDGWPK